MFLQMSQQQHRPSIRSITTTPTLNNPNTACGDTSPKWLENLRTRCLARARENRSQYVAEKRQRLLFPPSSSPLTIVDANRRSQGVRTPDSSSTHPTTDTDTDTAQHHHPSRFAQHLVQMEWSKQQQHLHNDDDHAIHVPISVSSSSSPSSNSIPNSFHVSTCTSEGSFWNHDTDPYYFHFHENNKNHNNDSMLIENIYLYELMQEVEAELEREGTILTQNEDSKSKTNEKQKHIPCHLPLRDRQVSQLFFS